MIGLVAVGAVVSLTACGLLPGRGGAAPEPAGNNAAPPADNEVVEDPEEFTESDIDVFDIVVGDCLNDDLSYGDTVEEVPIVSCDQPHDSEVFYSHIMAEDAWPGDAVIDGEAEEVCRDEFAAFIGVPYEQSIYGVSWYSPTQDSWENIDDREILCLVFDFDTQITGSLAGVAE